MRPEVQILTEEINNIRTTLQEKLTLLDKIQASCSHLGEEVSFPHSSGYKCTLCDLYHPQSVSICYTPNKCEHPPMLLPSQLKIREELEKKQVAEKCAAQGHPTEYDYGLVSCKCNQICYESDENS